MLLSIIFFILHFIVNFSSTSLTDLPSCVRSDNDCYVNNSVYVKSDGGCNEGFIHSGDKTKCLKVATGLTDSCEESQQCSEFLYPGGNCENGICVCKMGYHYLHGRCWRSSKLDEKCNSSEECYVNFDIAAATCKNNTCQCSNGYYQREYRSCRRRAQKVGDSCAIDLDCAFDESQYHMCNKTAGCVPGIHINSSKNIEFNNEIFKFNGKFFAASPDTNDKLVCERGHFYSEKENKCVAEIGELCSSNDTVFIKQSECFNNTWRCKSAYAPINNRLCNKATTKFNTSCLYNEQCYIFGPDAFCKDKRSCVCNESSHFIDEELFCWINKQPGELCNVDRDCFDSESKMDLKCVNNTCVCPAGTHLNSKKSCVKDVKAIGDSCTEFTDCGSLPNTNCTNNICSCVENYFEQLGKCIGGLKTFCNQSVNCETKNSRCINGTCICLYNYIAQSSGLCLPIRKYGELCTDSVQCNATDSNLFCLFDSDSPNGTCTCNTSYHYNYGKCFKRRVLGETCENIGECYVKSDPPLVDCFKGVCRCHENANKLDVIHCKNRSTRIPLSCSWVLSAAITSLLFHYIIM